MTTQKIKRLIFDKNARMDSLIRHGMYNYMSDEKFLKKIFYQKVGYKLDLDNPRTFNEKIQWLKLNDRKTIYTTMVDKYEAKRYISNIIGEQYVIPTLGVWEHFEDIDFEKLPNQFVLKCTHDSGGVVICDNKESFDKQVAKDKIKKSLGTNYYWAGREWPYRDVKPKIIAEEYIGVKSGNSGRNIDTLGLIDYKLMCFNGIVKCSFTCTERFSQDGLKVTFYDRNWNVLPFERHYHKSNINIPCPKNYSKMLSIAEKLATDIPFIRVDFFEVNGMLYIGELTLYPGSGFEEFIPVEWDYVLGKWLSINN